MLYPLVVISSINCKTELNSPDNIPFQKIFPDCKEVFSGNIPRAGGLAGNETTTLPFHCLSLLISHYNENKGKRRQLILWNC
jgi:hypothetical protein